jgi:hypothetical protein
MNRLGHTLPGLKNVEPTYWLLLGVLLICISAAFLLSLHSKTARVVIATAVAGAWTLLCALTLLDNLYAIGFVGQSDRIRDRFMWMVLPSYYFSGCAVLWLTYMVRQKIRRKNHPRPQRGGFPMRTKTG